MNTNYPSTNDTNDSPISMIQLQFWVIHEFEPDSPAYNMPSVSVIDGKLNIVALETAINTLVRRYPIFRTTFSIEDSGNVTMQAVPWQKVSLPQIDLRASKGFVLDENIVNQAVFEEITKPFNLTAGPPMRFKLYCSGECSYVLVVTAHHIVFDLNTKNMFAEELEKEYKLALLGKAEEGYAQKADYAVYAAWQQSWMRSNECKKMEKAWREYLDGAQPVLNLPVDQLFEDSSPNYDSILPIPIKLSDELFGKVQSFCRKENSTPFLVLLTAWALTLARCSGQTDLCLGIPLTNRRMDEFKSTMGCFVNSLPLRFDISDNPTIIEAVRRVRMSLLQMHRMQEMPYYHLVQLMRRKDDFGGNALYQAGFTFEHPMQLKLEGLMVKPKYIQPGGAQTDLFATFWQQTDSILGVIKYDSRKFKPHTVERIGRHLLDVTNEICESQEEKVGHKPFVIEKRNSAPIEKISIMAISASFTAEFLQEFLEFWFQKLDWRSEVKFAPFNQVFQELLNPSSLLRSNRKGHNVVMVRLEDLIDKDAAFFENTNEAVIRMSRVLEELKQAIIAGTKSMSVPLCFVLCPPSPRGKEIQNLAEERIGDFLGSIRSIPGVIVLTDKEIHQQYPVSDYYEALGEKIGAIPFTRRYLTALSTALIRSLNTLSLNPIKALVVDCDGTLWQGVVGENGPADLIIGPSQRAFQKFLLKQYQAGVILCLCSKNQEADVWSVFDQNPGMVLKREHISFWKINWEAKSINLRALVREMNIGMDTVAFLDDNPLERAEVGLHLPAIFCVEFPDAWEERTQWLEHCWLLDHPRATAEDKKRQEHYRSEQDRESIKQSAGSLAEFLEKLELQIDLNFAEEADYERLAQLSVRTNQFNTTVLRLTTQEVAEYATMPGMSAHSACVRDRFGDYGLVGAMFVREVGKACHVDCISLSCRALGRNVEYRMASYLASNALQTGCLEIVFPMRTTERNEPARNFLTHLSEQCGGTWDSEASLHLNAEKLAAFSYESITESKKETDAFPETLEMQSDLILQDREPFVYIAAEFRLVDAILNTVEQKAHNQHCKNLEIKTFPDKEIPKTETEKLIADVWKFFLGLSQINTQAKFFEVGGTSLLLVRIAIELKRKHGMDVSIIDMLKYPTINDLARHIDGNSMVEETPVAAVAESAIRQREIFRGRRLPAAFKRQKEKRSREE